MLINKKILFIGIWSGFVIFAIIFAFVLIRQNATKQGNNSAPTPGAETPRTAAEAARTLTLDEKSHIDIVTNIGYSRLENTQKQRLDNFKARLPYTSNDFDIEYIPVIAKYVAYFKTPNARESFIIFLQAQNVYDIYADGSPVFVTSTDPIDTTVAELIGIYKEEANHNDLEGEPNVRGVSTVRAQQPPAQPAASDLGDSGPPTQEDFTNMMDLFKAATTIMGGGPGDDSLPGAAPGGGGTPGGGGGIPGGATVDDAAFIQRLGKPSISGYVNMPDPVGDEYSLEVCENNQWGSPELAVLINRVGHLWKAKYPDSRLSVWDMNATGHASHMRGVDVDVGTTNQSAANMCSAFNNQPGTCGGGLSEAQCRSIEFGKMWISTNIVKYIFYDDPAVNEAVLAFARTRPDNKLTLMEPWGTQACNKGHHDHFHIRILDDYIKDDWAPSC